MFKMFSFKTQKYLKACLCFFICYPFFFKFQLYNIGACHTSPPPPPTFASHFRFHIVCVLCVTKKSGRYIKFHHLRASWY